MTSDSVSIVTGVKRLKGRMDGHEGKDAYAVCLRLRWLAVDYPDHQIDHFLFQRIEGFSLHQVPRGKSQGITLALYSGNVRR